MLVLYGYLDSFANQEKGLLTTQIPVRDLLKYYKINSEVNRDIIDPRVAKITSYIDTYDSEIGIYFPSVVLVANGEVPTINEQRNQFIFETNIQFIVLDGQHRIKALERFIHKEDNEARLLEILNSTITAQIYFELSEDAQRHLFLDINATSQKVSTSLSFTFDSRDPLNLIIKELLAVDNKNLQSLLKVDNKTKIVRPQNKNWLSIARLNRFLSYLLFNTVAISNKTAEILQLNYFEVAQFLEQYFEILISVFPEDFGDVTKYVLGHEAVQNALAILCHEKIIKIEGNSISFKVDWQDTLEHLILFDWTNNSPLFKNLLISRKNYKGFPDAKHSEVLPILRSEWDDHLEIID